MKEDQPNHLDDYFKQELGDHTPTPSADNWRKIASELEGQSLDGFVKNHLEDMAPTPHPENWEKIRKQLPLSLLLRNQLNWLSGMAAMLILFMIAVLLLDKKPITNEASAEVISKIENDDQIIVEKATPNDFVFAINENSEQRESSASEELFLEDEDTMEELWNDLLDGDEEIVAQADTDIIQKSLEPLRQLPAENLEATTNGKYPPNSDQPNTTLQEFPIILPNGKAITEEK
ncbi:MAG: hypothetical protein AAF573_04000 [Bacteroidota bacterium]